MLSFKIEFLLNYIISILNTSVAKSIYFKRNPNLSRPFDSHLFKVKCIAWQIIFLDHALWYLIILKPTLITLVFVVAVTKVLACKCRNDCIPEVKAVFRKVGAAYISDNMMPLWYGNAFHKTGPLLVASTSHRSIHLEGPVFRNINLKSTWTNSLGSGDSRYHDARMTWLEVFYKGLIAHILDMLKSRSCNIAAYDTRSTQRAQIFLLV